MIKHFYTCRLYTYLWSRRQLHGVWGYRNRHQGPGASGKNFI